MSDFSERIGEILKDEMVLFEFVVDRSGPNSRTDISSSATNITTMTEGVYENYLENPYLDGGSFDEGTEFHLKINGYNNGMGLGEEVFTLTLEEVATPLGYDVNDPNFINLIDTPEARQKISAEALKQLTGEAEDFLQSFIEVKIAQAINNIPVSDDTPGNEPGTVHLDIRGEREENQMYLSASTSIGANEFEVGWSFLREQLDSYIERGLATDDDFDITVKFMDVDGKTNEVIITSADIAEMDPSLSREQAIMVAVENGIHGVQQQMSSPGIVNGMAPVTGPTFGR